jgi:serine/threonine protein kinase
LSLGQSYFLQRAFKVFTSNIALDFLDKLLQFDPEKRMTCEEALNHPYLSAYHDEKDEVKLVLK